MRTHDPGHPTLGALLFALCVLAVTPGEANGQWQLIDPPHPGEIEDFGIADGEIDVVYVATNPDGAWQTEDGGATDLVWLFSGMGLFEVHMTAVPIAPSNSLRRYTMSVGGGIRTTDDGGQTWTPGSFPGGGAHVDRPWVAMAISPVDDQALLAGGEGTIKRSLDAASSWADTTGVPADVVVTDIEFVSGSDGAPYVWAGTSDCALWEERECVEPLPNHSHGVLGSLDGGQSWTEIPVEPSDPTHPKNFVNAVATVPGQPFYLLAATEDGLWVTVDAGANWADHTPPGLAPRRVTDVFYADTPSPTIYVGTEVGVWRGDVSAGTVTWTQLNTFPIDFVTAIDSTSATSDLLWAGYQHGDVWKTTDAGTTAGEVSGAHGAYPLSTIAIKSDDSHTLYTGTVCQQGIFKGTIPSAGNPSWTVMERPSGKHFHYVMRLAQDPGDGETTYATETDWIWGTADAGANWTFLTPQPPPGKHLHGLAVAPSNPSRLYMGTGHGNWGSHTNTYVVWRNDSQGQPTSWIDVTNNFPQYGTETSLFDIAVSPIDQDVVYVATFGSENYPGDLSQGVGQGMVRSLDAGATWTAINAGLTGTADSLFVGRIAMATRNGILTTYIATLDGLYKMVGATGTSWQDVSPGDGWRRFESIAVDPVNQNVLYAGTSELPGNPARIYRSVDGGSSWSQMTLQMEPLAWSAQYRVRDIQVARDRAYAVVEGSGVYMLNGPDLDEIRQAAVLDAP